MTEAELDILLSSNNKVDVIGLPVQQSFFSFHLCHIELYHGKPHQYLEFFENIQTEFEFFGRPFIINI